MVERASGVPPVRTKPGKLKYFFLNGMLHKTLHINRGKDTITTWCYPLAKRVAYSYSDSQRYREYAYSSDQVGEMLNRKRLQLERAILAGFITRPQHSYGLTEEKGIFAYFWNEEAILEAHEHFSNTHRGRPRKDGLITPQKLPTLKELRAMIRQEEVMYVRDSDGEFRPVWRAQDFS